MQVEFFTLCDGAYNYNGKLTIVGTVDGIKLSSLPGIADFSIAMKLLVMPEEHGKKEVSIHIIDPLENEIPTNIVMNFEVESNSEDSHLSIAIGMHGVPFKQEGRHMIKVQLGDELLGNYAFFVKVK